MCTISSVVWCLKRLVISTAHGINGGMEIVLVHLRKHMKSRHVGGVLYVLPLLHCCQVSSPFLQVENLCLLRGDAAEIVPRHLQVGSLPGAQGSCWGFPKMGVPSNGWFLYVFIVEKSWKSMKIHLLTDDSGAPLF